jgi:hypothetical protein
MDQKINPPLSHPSSRKTTIVRILSKKRRKSRNLSRSPLRKKPRRKR